MTPEILLQAYVRHQSEDAFRELVANTLDAVYSTSLRIAQGAPHLASEIAVKVYLELARKGRWLRKDIVLASWLRDCTCKMAVTVLRAEDRPVDRAVLKKEKKGLSVPTSMNPAPAGLAARIGYAIFLNPRRNKGLSLSSLTAWWPAWLGVRQLGAAAACVLTIMVWRSHPFRHRNPIIKSEGPLMTPSSIAQLASPDEGGPSAPALTANTNAGTNPRQK